MPIPPKILVWLLLLRNSNQIDRFCSESDCEEKIDVTEPFSMKSCKRKITPFFGSSNFVQFLSDVCSSPEKVNRWRRNSHCWLLIARHWRQCKMNKTWLRRIMPHKSNMLSFLNTLFSSHRWSTISSSSSSSVLENLPNELLQEILSYLSVSDIFYGWWNLYVRFRDILSDLRLCVSYTGQRR